MEILKSIFYMLIEMSLVASVVGIVTLIIKNIFKSKISPKWLNAIWIVFLIVLINPIRFQSDFSIYNIFDYQKILPFQQENIINEALDKHTILKSYFDKTTEENNSQNFNVGTSNDETYFDFSNMSEFIASLRVEAIVIMYFVVVFCILIVRLLTNTRINLNTRKKIENERVTSILKDVQNRYNLNKNVELINQDIISTPAIYGTFNSKILLNEKLLELSDAEIELILLHEVSHIKRGDIYMNKLLQILKIIYCFNPLIIMLLNQIKKDLELANDEYVVKGFNKTKINLYCKTLLKISLISDKELFSALGMASDADGLEERIRMIKDKDKFFTNKILIISTVLILVLSITVCFATSRITNENSEIIENQLNSGEADLIDNQLNKTETNLMENMFEENKIKVTEKNIITTNESETNAWKVVNPLDGELKVSYKYGKRVHPLTNQEIYHSGVDLVAEKGEIVKSITDGIVEATGFDVEQGNTIEIKHIDEATNKVIYSFYAHLSKIDVEIGQTVKAGDKIGEVGATGKATGPHLHFEIRNSDKVAMDPTEFIK